MAITGLTGVPIHKGSWLGLPDLGITERIQGTGSTSPASAQQAGTGNADQTWNQGWNAGFNSGGNPYSGSDSNYKSGYSSGWQEYLNRNRSSGGGGVSPSGGATSNQSNPQTQNVNNNVIDGAAEEARRREEETRRGIESGYGEYENNLRGLLPQYENSKQESLGSASKVYEQLFGGLNDQKQTNLDKLQAGREEVNARQASSIKDLQDNLSTVLRGASMQFGAMGAGDTSATRTMLPYAYTKMAGAQEGGIRKQSNQQQFEIDQEERDTELKFSEMWRQTESEKETQLQGIRDYYGTAIQNIQTAMAQAPADKAQALAGLNQSLLQEAQANLRQLEAEDRQKKEGIKTWATNRVSELNNIKLQLAGSASFSPQDIMWNELSVQGVGPGQNGQGMDFTDYVTATRKKYLGE